MYSIGIVTAEEAARLERAGWQLEPPPRELMPTEPEFAARWRWDAPDEPPVDKDGCKFVMLFVDAGLLDVIALSGEGDSAGASQ